MCLPLYHHVHSQQSDQIHHDSVFSDKSPVLLFLLQDILLYDLCHHQYLSIYTKKRTRYSKTGDTGVLFKVVSHNLHNFKLVLPLKGAILFQKKSSS